MRRNKFTKAAALLLGLSLAVTGVPANVSAASLTAEEVVVSGETQTTWTYNAVADPDTHIYLNVYAGKDHTKSETLGWYKYTDDANKTYDYVGYAFSSAYEIDNLGEYTVKGKRLTLREYSFDPGTYNVELVTYNYAAYKNAQDAYYKGGSTGKAPVSYDYYQVKNLGTIKVAAPKTGLSTVVTKNSVQLIFTKRDRITGYEVYRLEGKNKVKLATTTIATYTDKGLDANTTYKYSVRTYYVDPEKNTTTYGEYAKCSAKTLGSAMNLECDLAGAKLNKVKLTWTKVSDASAYKVYRRAVDSSNTKVKNGKSTDEYDAYELLKTLKGKAKNYTDKTVESGMSYAYMVEAVIGKDSKAVAYGTNGADLTFKSPYVTAYTKANGSVVASWNKVSGAAGYKVYQEVYDASTGAYQYKKIATLKKTKTSYTFKALPLSVYADDIQLQKNQIGQPDKEYEDGKYYVVTVLNDVEKRTEYPNADAQNAAYKAEMVKYVNYNRAVAAAEDNNEASYIIRAYKGKVVSSNSNEITVKPTLGVATGIKAKAASNGIKVTWKAIKGANYYRVYRIKSGAMKTDADMGTTEAWEGANNANPMLLSFGNEGWVTNYVGLTALKAAPLEKGETEKKYYQNFQYATDKIIGTSVLDYSGKVADSYSESDSYDANGNPLFDAYGLPVATAGTVKESDLYTVGPQKGVEYQYYVVGYYNPDFAENGYDPDRTPTVNGKEVKLYRYLDTATNTYKYTTTPLAKDLNEGSVSSCGCKGYGKAAFSSTKKPTAANIKKVAAKGTKVTITFKKKPSKVKATEYRVYRSTKKKGAFKVVGTTTKAKFVDSTVQKGVTYYYKAVAVKANEAKADVEAKASKVKNVKIKGSAKKAAKK